MLISSSFLFSQVTIDTSHNPYWLAINSLVGNGVTPYDIKFNGVLQTATSPVKDQAAQFLVNFNPNNIGFEANSKGLLLTTGKSSVALVGPNNTNNLANATNESASLVEGDSDLAQLSGHTIRKVSILEFDFVATGLSLNFDFVFGSEEYPEYVGTMFNDTFGFFLRGPGITGPFSNNSKNFSNSACVVTLNASCR